MRSMHRTVSSAARVEVLVQVERRLGSQYGLAASRRCARVHRVVAVPNRCERLNRRLEYMCRLVVVCSRRHGDATRFSCRGRFGYRFKSVTLYALASRLLLVVVVSLGSSRRGVRDKQPPTPPLDRPHRRARPRFFQASRRRRNNRSTCYKYNREPTTTETKPQLSS